MDSVKELQDPAVTELVTASNAFGLELYQRLKTARNNLILSPQSICVALAMVYAGSAGETQSQLGAALRYAGQGHHLDRAFSMLQRRLKSLQESGSVEILSAQGLWLQRGYRIHPDFLELIETHYRAAVLPVDFVQDPDAARAQINQWIEENTNRRIKDLLPAGAINVLTRLVLANAIYFRGDWRHPFDPERTALDVFWTESGTSVQAPFMVQEVETGYAESGEWQLLRLPYAGGDVSMAFILPRRRDGLAALETTLSAQDLARQFDLAQRRKVNVLLPHFKATSGFSPKTALMAMGVTDAFDQSKADFSRLAAADDPLHISAITHKAFIEVNEQGTEAAAATGVVLAARSMPPPPAFFRADHPFLFMIRDEMTGAILFLGRVANPAARE